MFVDSVSYTSKEGIETKHMMVRHDKAIGLFIMLPGGNNTSDRPIMHLTRKGMLDKGYDVLNVDYTNLINKDMSFEYNCERILEVLQGVLAKKLSEYKNQNIKMFCRSLGSLVGAKLYKDKALNIDKVVMISPTSLTVDEMESMKCKLYLDPMDKHLSHASYKNLLSMDEVLIKEYSGVGHNFEIDNDLEKTIDIIKDVVLDMIKYLD